MCEIDFLNCKHELTSYAEIIQVGRYKAMDWVSSLHRFSNAHATHARGAALHVLQPPSNPNPNAVSSRMQERDQASMKYFARTLT